MKVFISQPMNGKTDAQIREERRIVEIRLHRKINEKFEILDTVFDLDEGTHPLVYLGKSIEKIVELKNRIEMYETLSEEDKIIMEKFKQIYK